MTLSLAEAFVRCASCPEFMAGGWCREASGLNYEDEEGRGPVIVCRRPSAPMVAITEIEICPRGRKTTKGEES